MIKEEQKCICKNCKKITDHELVGLKTEVKFIGFVDALGYQCLTCGEINAYPDKGLMYVKEAIKKHRDNAPSIESIVSKFPTHRLNKWVKHDNDVCDCNETDKGVDCDNDLSQYYYSKSDWLDYIKRKE